MAFVDAERCGYGADAAVHIDQSREEFAMRGIERCPTGDIADVGPAPPLIMYGVDANLTATKLPGIKYLLPPGLTIPPTLDPCVGLSSP